MFSEIKSSDLKVGDIALVKDGETFPADFAVIATS
jgi:magnesium-transporting ATPase (P-type)